MNTHLFRKTLLMMALSLFAAASAYPAEKENVKEIVKRLKARFVTIEKRKDEGKIGETYAGYVEAVKDEYASDERISKLIAAENADRKALYTHIAKQEDTSPEKVGRRNAIRKFDKASTGEWLKGEDGKWRQKE